MPVSYWLCKVPLQRSAWQCHLNKYIFNNNNNNNNNNKRQLWWQRPVRDNDSGHLPDSHFLFMWLSSWYSFTIPRRVKGSFNLGTAVRVCSPCPRLYITVAIMINNCSWWDSNLDSLTVQSGISSVDQSNQWLNRPVGQHVRHIALWCGLAVIVWCCRPCLCHIKTVWVSWQ